MEKKQIKDYHYLLKCADIVADYILNFLSTYVCFFLATFFFAPRPDMGGMNQFLIISVVCLVISFLYNYHNVYLPMRHQSPLFFLARIFWVHLEIFAFLAIIILLSKVENKGFFMGWLFFSSVLGLTLIASKKIAMLFVLHSVRARQRNIKKILILTDSVELTEDFMTEIFTNPQFGYSVIGYIGNLSVPGLTHLGSTGDLDTVLREKRPDEVIMAFDTVRKKLLTKYISICNDNCVKVLVVPAVCGCFKSPRQISMMGNLPIVDIRSTPLDSLSNQIIKRALDIVGSLFMIVVTSPLMLFTAIGVKLSSPGPILFRQTRVGRQNKEFTMYKFRSMKVNDEQQTGWSTDEDPRKTKFGNFIRKFALDELPQFFNVLKGDMSLVGPRPEVPFYVEKFRKEIPLYMLKHSLRPGITGQAQVKGLRGDTSIQERIDEDINYIENWTFWKDIRILLITPFRTVNRHEKYAEREEMQKKKDDFFRIGTSGGATLPDQTAEENTGSETQDDAD